MTKIHMQTEEVRYMAHQIDQAVLDLSDHQASLYKKAQQMPHYWRGGKKPQRFAANLQNCVKGLGQLIEQMEALGIAAAHEVDQWQGVDADGVGSFRDSIHNIISPTEFISDPGSGKEPLENGLLPIDKNIWNIFDFIKKSLRSVEYGVDNWENIFSNLFPTAWPITAGSAVLTATQIAAFMDKYHITGIMKGLKIAGIAYDNWVDPNNETVGQKIAATALDSAFEVAKSAVVAAVAAAAAGTATAATVAGGVAASLTGVGIPAGVAAVVASVVVSAAVYAGTSWLVGSGLGLLYKSTGLREILIEALGGWINKAMSPPPPSK